EHHWSKSREGTNEEALEYLRERSQRPGVAEGGSSRNMYCPECQGVIPLEYDSRVAPEGGNEQCPHCGAALPERVREMFNWVEIDQVSGSDAKALLPLFLGIVLLFFLLCWGLLSWMA
ncbi:MAG: hypothetical protein AAF368_11635, partial [Planctomycetota bacterium]